MRSSTDRVSNMKFCILLGIALYVGGTPLLLAQSNQSTTDQKPATAKSDEKGANQPDARTTHGPIDILSDTGGVDVHPYLDHGLPLIKASWYKLIPESAWFKKGKVTIRFNIMKDGQIDDALILEKSGDSVLDQAAYEGITASSPLPSLPSDFGCKYLVLQIRFYYNLAVPPSKDPTGSLIPCVTTKINSVQPVVIAVSPASVEVITGAMQQFSAKVIGDPGAEVNWTVSGSGCSGPSCGSISPQGLYAAPPSIPSPPKVIVTATLASDPTETSTATVTVVRPPTTR